MIDKEILPQFTREIVDCYLQPALPRADYDYLVLMVLHAVSKILCCNRCILDNRVIDTDGAYPNLYILSFGRSGSGKDRSLGLLKRLLSGVDIAMKGQFKSYFDSKKEEVIKEAEVKFTSKTNQHKYINEKSPRYLKITIGSNSTLEGFLSQREAFQDANFGCTVWESSEIFDTLRQAKSSPNMKEFITQNKEAFDKGDNKGKTIKAEKKAIDVKRVPHLALLHGAVNTAEKEELFKEFFDLGFARRCMVCLPGDKVFKKMSVEELKKLSLMREENTEACCGLFEDLFNKTANDPQVKYGGNIVFTFDKDAEDLYLEYCEDCAEKQSRLRGGYNEGLIAELSGRHWKAVKLSAILAAQESVPEDDKILITGECLMKAMAIIDYYATHFNKFYMMTEVSLESEVISYIIENPGVTKTDLKKSKLFKGTLERVNREFEQTMYSLPEVLSAMGKVLIEEKGGYNNKATTYKIEEIPEHKEVPVELTVRCSQGISNKPTETKMLPKTVAFEKLHEIVTAPYIYSPAVFNDNYRNGKNWMSNDDLLVLDFDNEVPKEQQLTIEMAKQKFKQFTNLIVPTKSHNKDKNGETRERFRVLLPIVPLGEIDRGKYKEIMENFIEYFHLDGEKWLDTGAASDPAKMYFGCNAKYEYNKGKLLNCAVFNFHLHFKQKGDKEFKHEFDKNTTLVVKGKPMGWDEYLMEVKRIAPETIPCIAHCHDDKNPSAFISINEHGNFQYTCSSCGLSEYCNLT